MDDLPPFWCGFSQKFYEIVGLSGFGPQPPAGRATAPADKPARGERRCGKVGMFGKDLDDGLLLVPWVARYLEPTC